MSEAKVKLTEAQRAEQLRHIARIEAIVSLAQAGFPGRSDVRVEVIGTAENTGAVILPAYILSIFCRMARAALSEGEAK